MTHAAHKERGANLKSLVTQHPMAAGPASTPHPGKQAFWLKATGA